MPSFTTNNRHHSGRIGTLTFSFHKSLHESLYPSEKKQRHHSLLSQSSQAQAIAIEKLSFSLCESLIFLLWFLCQILFGYFVFASIHYVTCVWNYLYRDYYLSHKLYYVAEVAWVSLSCVFWFWLVLFIYPLPPRKGPWNVKCYKISMIIYIILINFGVFGVVGGYTQYENYKKASKGNFIFYNLCFELSWLNCKMFSKKNIYSSLVIPGYWPFVTSLFIFIYFWFQNCCKCSTTKTTTSSHNRRRNGDTTSSQNLPTQESPAQFGHHSTTKHQHHHNPQSHQQTQTQATNINQETTDVPPDMYDIYDIFDSLNNTYTTTVSLTDTYHRNSNFGYNYDSMNNNQNITDPVAGSTLIGGVGSVVSSQNGSQQQQASLTLHQSLNSSLAPNQQQQGVQQVPNINLNINNLSLVHTLQSTDSSRRGSIKNKNKNNNMNNNYKYSRFTRPPDQERKITGKTKSVFDTSYIYDTIDVDNLNFYFYFWLMMYFFVWALFYTLFWIVAIIKPKLVKKYFDEWYYTFLILTSIVKWLLKRIARKLDCARIQMKQVYFIQKHSINTKNNNNDNFHRINIEEFNQMNDNLHIISFELMTEMLVTYVYYGQYRLFLSYYLPPFTKFALIMIGHLFSEFCQTTVRVSHIWFTYTSKIQLWALPNAWKNRSSLVSWNTQHTLQVSDYFGQYGGNYESYERSNNSIKSIKSNNSNNININNNEMVTVNEEPDSYCVAWIKCYIISHFFDDCTYEEWKVRCSIDIITRLVLSLFTGINQCIWLFVFGEQYYAFSRYQVIKSLKYTIISIGFEIVYFIVASYVNRNVNKCNVVNSFVAYYQTHYKMLLLSWVVILSWWFNY